MDSDIKIESVILDAPQMAEVVFITAFRFGEKVFQANLEIKNHRMNIDDLLVNELNIGKGYGSLVMCEILKLASIKGVKEITGYISQVDWNHIDRLKHFYQKFSFSILVDDLKKEGKIQLLL